MPSPLSVCVSRSDSISPSITYGLMPSSLEIMFLRVVVLPTPGAPISFITRTPWADICSLTCSAIWSFSSIMFSITFIFLISCIIPPLSIQYKILCLFRSALRQYRRKDRQRTWELFQKERRRKGISAWV